MNLAERIATKVLNKAFQRWDVIVRGDLYLRRWYITPLDWPTRIFVHYIAASDDTRVLHDHPWDFTTFILARGYTEHLPAGPVWRAPLSVHHNNAEHVHAVAPSKGAAWTIMFVKPARRMWGFHTATGWETWRKYLKKPDAADRPEDVIPV